MSAPAPTSALTTSPQRAERRPASAALLALASGLAWGSCFAARPWWPLSTLALAPLLFALDARRPFFWGWLHGVATWALALSWLVGTLTQFGQLDGWLAGFSLLLLAGFLGLYHGLFAALGARLWRRGGGRALLALPALWMALEVARGWVFGGFPWNLAAYAWTELPGALPLAAFIGAQGVSWLVLSVNVAFALAWRTRRWELAGAVGLAIATLLAVGGRWGEGGSPEGRSRQAAIVQPDTPNQVVFRAEIFERDYARLLDISRRACRPGVLVIWPESAAWPLEYGRDPRLAADLAALNAEGCAVLFNSIYAEQGRYYNSALLLDATGTLARYDKRHLVPFGEYVPLAPVFPFLRRIARSAGDFSPASGLRLLPWWGERLGAAICYEVVFPREVAELVRAGATALVTITNDGWYGDTAAPWQHLRAARFRAAENRRWLLRAALTGVSAAIAPDGSVRGELGVGEQGILTVPFVGRSDLAPYTRAPWLVPGLGFVVAAIGWLAARRDPAIA